ncbi:MAG: type II secretion system F family protein [Thermoplasmata archaeon]
MTKTKKIAKELHEAREAIYIRKDKTRMAKALSVVLGLLFLTIAILNLVNVVNISFKTLEPGSGFDTDGDGVPDQAVHPVRRFLNFMAMALMGFVGPYGFYMARKQKEVKAIERRLPDFLRDVAEAGRFGMTLAEAIVVAAQGRYGVLTDEIKKMAAQIQWGVPATDALRLFAERVKTPLVERVVAIVIKASDAGGEVADVLTMVSHDAKEVQLTEDERRISMSTYIAVIYISFGVFIVTIWILGATFLPKMQEAAADISQGEAGVISASPLPTNIPEIIFNIEVAFFIAVIVHAMGDGILAGILDSGKVANGLRHSFIMLLIAVLGFQLI